MDDDSLVNEFLVESHENLDQLDRDLVSLESNPTDPELLSRVFRTIHTVKGTCAFLGFTKLEWVTHVGENLLSRMRDGEIRLSADITTALLALSDAVRQILSSIESTRNEGDVDYQPLVETLARLQEGGAAVATPPTDDAAGPSPESTIPDATEATVHVSRQDVDLDDGTPFDQTLPELTLPEASDGSDQSVATMLMEIYERAEEIDRHLVELAENPADQDLISRTLDALGVLSSTSESLQLAATASATRESERLLTRVRDGNIRFDPEVSRVLMSLIDVVRQTLAAIEQSGEEDASDYGAVVAALNQLNQAAADQTAQTEQTILAIPSPPLHDQPVHDLPVQDQPVHDQTVHDQTVHDQTVHDQIVHDQAVQDQAVQDQAVQDQAVQDQPVQGQAIQESPQPQGRGGVADASIRVDVGLLDSLMDQVGELVLVRNRIMQFVTIQEDRDILAAYQRLDLITSELQERFMKTRMQPIGTIWSKFPRVVRDLATDCGKRVTLSMEGEETELDRTLIEAIRDPLTHLVRNAVDHGIESPESRRSSGKPETGHLFLHAYHEGGQVNILIGDDGAGIDPDRLVRQAVQRNLISAAQAGEMREREIFDLIFAPGFSTAERVTNVSGRGVGMDVVKNNIEKINGSIDIQSRVGQGTTVKIKIPLTLAIIPALIVRCAGDRYAIPQANLIELVRLEGEVAATAIETIHGAPVYRLRGDLLPLVYLESELEIQSLSADVTAQTDQRVVNIVVVQADQQQFGLVVEDVIDTEEIVVKPLGKHIREIDVFAGATIMGDGKVALILDVLGLANRAHVLSERVEDVRGDHVEEDQQPTALYQTLLLFEGDEGRSMALPLSRVTRLEKLPYGDVERSGRYDVIQYWGEVMPLIDVSHFLCGDEVSSTRRGSNHETREALEVVVLAVQSGNLGLVVDRIVDTVEGAHAIQPLSSRPGVAGTLIVRGRVTELLDLDEMIRLASPAIFEQVESTGAKDWRE